jgi:hypothetical protein
MLVKQILSSSERSDRGGVVRTNIKYPLEIAKMKQLLDFRPQAAQPQGRFAKLHLMVQG